MARSADFFEKSMAGRFFLEISLGASISLGPAVRQIGGNSLCITTAFDASLDILEPNFLEQLLFLCGSGTVAYLATSLGPPHSPTVQPFFTPDPLADELHAQDTFCRVTRCCWLLSIAHTAGGQGHLSLSAASALWSEPSVRGWAQQGNCAMIPIQGQAARLIFACRNLGHFFSAPRIPGANTFPGYT